MTTLAYEILQWARANKKELQELEANLSIDDERPILTLLDFERRYRGAAHFLRNPNHPDCPDGFQSSLRASVHWLIGRLLKTRTQGGLLDGLLDLQGLELNEFRGYYRQYLTGKLIELTGKEPNIKIFYGPNEAWRSSGRSGSLKGWVIELSNGMAKTTHEDFISLELPEGQGEGSLRTQLAILAEGWITTRETFKGFISNKANWPTEGQRIADEKNEIRKLADTFFKSLSATQAELMRKHPDAFKERFNARFWSSHWLKQ
jgi:hypothetical protein